MEIESAAQQTNIGEVNLNRDLRLEIAPRKLLEVTHGERLDTLSPASQAKKIRNLLTVAEIDRTEVA